jgi:putative nucleotidyltransferase with HDIG domain
MPSWSQPSPEPAGPQDERLPGEEGGEELARMRRAFVEALRRAEIITLLSNARTEAELGRLLAEELCEVYDAEVGLVAEVGAGGSPRPLGVVGIGAMDRDRVLAAEEIAHALASSRAVGEQGSDLLGLGARTCLFCSFRTADGRRVVIGVARMYGQAFDSFEVALLEAVSVSAGQALERIWAHAERDELISRLKASLVGTAEALANALEAKDDYTANHASEVAELAVAVGTELGMGEDELEALRYGAIFHDIGKIAIPDAILNKPGPLDEEERAVMMQHPAIGADILAPIPFLPGEVRTMVRHDHEHFDGTGYPDGLAGERIPIGSRIILVVDGYHAMTSYRPYRKALSEADARAELARHSGTQFDPDIVAAFLRIVS